MKLTATYTLINLLVSSFLYNEDTKKDATMTKKQENRGKHKTEEAKNRNHCAQGHEYTLGNTYKNPKGARVCRKCKNAWQKKARFKKDLLNLKKYKELLKIT